MVGRFQTKILIYSFIFCCIFIFLAAILSLTGGAQERKDNAYNVILISIDTLRYDHLGFSGYSRRTTPNIDRELAKKGIVFTQAISQSNWTLPSNISIFTSQYVPRHNVDRAYKKLDDRAVTLAEILNLYGYETAAFTGGFHVSSIFGLAQGFKIFDDQREHARLEDLLPLAENWLKIHRNDKFFLFIQANDCHAPFKIPQDREHKYDPGYKGIIDDYIFNYNLSDLIREDTLVDRVTGERHALTKADIDHVIAHYDAAIDYMDTQIGRFLKEIRKLHLMNDTIIIFLGDHGEELMDHGGRILKRKHGDAYEEGIHVPLIILHPALNKKGFKIDRQVQLIDVAPTILDFLNIPVHHDMQGESLVPLIEGRAARDFNKYVFTGNFNRDLPEPFPEYMAIRTEEWKLIHIFDFKDKEEKFELYNLKNDSKERYNLVEEYPQIFTDLKEKLYQWNRICRESAFSDIINKNLLQEVKERMRNFGYWWLGGELDPGEISRDKSQSEH